MSTQRILPMLISLVILLIFAQTSLLAIHLYIDNIDPAVSYSLKKYLIFTPHDYIQLVKFISAQLLIYSFYIFAIWFITISLSELFSLSHIKSLCNFLFAISILFILSANIIFVPHSFFSSLIRNDLFKSALSISHYKIVFISTAIILGAASIAAITNMIITLWTRQALLRHYAAALLLVIMILISGSNYLSAIFHQSPESPANEKTPNIFIIGFDALRPDFLSYFDNQKAPTPHFDQFLQSSVVFNNAYTPLARTFPSWVGILTSKYPLHTGARENMLDPASLTFSTTLPIQLKIAGYSTLFATDDSRYNYVNNAKFGFDEFIGAPGKKIDLILTTINDLPLSNLIIPSIFGKYLFPSNYANHDSPHTYNPDNFLDLIDNALDNHHGKPLLLAAHINSTAWPFYWYNDGQFDADSKASIYLYQHAVSRADIVLRDLITILKRHRLLDHAIFILISDHGITLQMPNDRVVSSSLYQGNKKDIHLEVSSYHAPLNVNASNYVVTPNEMTINTSYGYGSDVLSLKQYHSLLAFKLYGIGHGVPHTINEPVLLLDITPTLLDFAHLPPINNADGTSLLTSLLSQNQASHARRSIFIESSFSLSTIQDDKIDAGNVLKEAISSFEIMPANDLVSMTPAALSENIQHKQRAILSGDWLLAYYPSAIQSKIIFNKNGQGKITSFTIPSYTVLVNLKTGKWSTDMSGKFAKTAPFANLAKNLHHFYEAEINYYINPINQHQ